MRGIFVALFTSGVVSLSSISVAQVTKPDAPPSAAENCPAAQSDVVRTTMVHEPAAGQSTAITPGPREALSFDFSPFDAQAFRHGRDLILRFADNGVVVLRRIFHAETLLPIPIRLPDGTVITLCELLEAMPGEQDDADARKIPTGKVPAEERASDRKIPSEGIITP